MNLRYRFARRGAFALGSCALLLAPLAVRAQVATETKQADAKPADAAANSESYTLRLKFKQGNVNRYKTQVKTKVTSPSGLGGETKTVDANSTSVAEQKTTKLLENGAAELLTTTTGVKLETDGKATDAPKIPPVTTQITPTAKVLSTKTDDADAPDMMKSLFTNSFSSPQSFLPDAAVKIGDKWTQKFSLPAPLNGKEGTMDCSLTRIETLNGVKTALIHAIMKVPMMIFLDGMGQPTKVEGDAMAIFDGALISNMDINFAIDEGKIARAVNSGDMNIAIKLGKAAPPEAASFLPEGSKVVVKMNMDMSLLAPGEKVETPKTDAPKTEDAKPEKK